MSTSASARPQTDAQRRSRTTNRRPAADAAAPRVQDERTAGTPANRTRRRRRSGRGGATNAAPTTTLTVVTPETARPDRTAHSTRPRRAGRAAGPADQFRTAAPAVELRAAAPLTEIRPMATTDSAAGAGFADLGVPAVLLPALDALGAAAPFPIQAATLPATLAGRDVLGRGKTGSGKTIAFAIPLVARLSGGRRTPGRPRGLVLLPTRELALQVARTVDPLAKAAGLRTVVIFGGVGYGNQTAALRRGVDIVIACPGRLEDLVNQRECDLSGVDVTVLDEADHMADLGFLPVVRRLLRATPRNGQRLLFSATLDNGISVLVNEFLSDPVMHAVDDATSPVAAMEHHIFAVDAADRTAVIREMARGTGRRLLFTRTKHGAKKWAAALTKNGTPAVDLHGNLSQNARERNLAAFSSGAARVLVATDIAARGIHVDDVELVVHLDPPVEHKAYLHRSGRTARAGAAGTVITVMTPDQRDDVRKLMKQAGITAATVRVSPGHPAIAELAG